MENQKANPAHVGLGCLFLMLFVGFLFYLIASNSGSGSKTVGGSYETTARLDCFCATEYDEAETLIRSITASDTRAIQGLIVRGKAIKIDEGTTIHVVDTERIVAHVRIASGFHTGEKCYIHRNFLTARQD